MCSNDSRSDNFMMDICFSHYCLYAIKIMHNKTYKLSKDCLQSLVTKCMNVYKSLLYIHYGLVNVNIVFVLVLCLYEGEL